MEKESLPSFTVKTGFRKTSGESSLQDSWTVTTQKLILRLSLRNKFLLEMFGTGMKLKPTSGMPSVTSKTTTQEVTTLSLDTSSILGWKKMEQALKSLLSGTTTTELKETDGSKANMTSSSFKTSLTEATSGSETLLASTTWVEPPSWPLPLSLLQPHSMV